MQCPICDGLADDLPNTIDGKSIHCSRCGDFDVSGSVYDAGMLQQLDPEERREALENAKRSAAQGKRPMITTHSLRKAVFVGSSMQEANRKADDWTCESFVGRQWVPDLRDLLSEKSISGLLQSNMKPMYEAGA